MDLGLAVGDEVAWKWGLGVASGTVVEIIPEKVTIESKGKLITRNSTPADPAVIIRHTSGTAVLKLWHELQPMVSNERKC